MQRIFSQSARLNSVEEVSAFFGAPSTWSCISDMFIALETTSPLACCSVVAWSSVLRKPSKSCQYVSSLKFRGSKCTLSFACTTKSDIYPALSCTFQARAYPVISPSSHIHIACTVAPTLIGFDGFRFTRESCTLERTLHSSTVKSRDGWSIMLRALCCNICEAPLVFHEYEPDLSSDRSGLCMRTALSWTPCSNRSKTSLNRSLSLA